jgi:hypothetical protein
MLDTGLSGNQRNRDCRHPFFAELGFLKDFEIFNVLHFYCVLIISSFGYLPVFLFKILLTWP